MHAFLGRAKAAPLANLVYRLSVAAIRSRSGTIAAQASEKRRFQTSEKLSWVGLRVVDEVLARDHDSLMALAGTEMVIGSSAELVMTSSVFATGDDSS